ncbi:glycoside hydrolase family 3 protein [Ruoffia tabacinasalis]|uniref:beta-N-acetylhexosaminidase n=1 Tax=Ruoffia tabacinasalis TaxID=87458 RepID=A0ABS0LJ10_9LACT|nr:glycoside hydrolase family 3 N-terminal domain-containing protein [Ruoffia tabacinasalis]MBG9978257.1 beta-hexosaminidase [Ruoffia tabacinasalis]
MKKWSKIVLSTVLALSAFPMAPNLASAEENSTTDTAEIVDNLMSEMTLEEKITQTMMPDFRNWMVDGEEVGVTELNDDIRQILTDYKFGGVILFAENVVETDQTARLVYQFQQTMVDNQHIPLLIGIDQEGGIVNRLGSGTQLPGNMALGATGDPANAQTAGSVIGSELEALGINVNFAPTVDVNNNPKNPVIGLRSFSSDPDIVSEFGLSYIEGIREHNVAVAAKHFPGHGDTDVDSHYGLPLVDKSLEELEANELIPFKAAMDQNVDMIMTAHIQFPQLESETKVSEEDGSDILLPATLSPAILTDLVRDKMGYEGIVITDALNMQAIADNFGEVDTAILSKQAGADILLMPVILRSNDDLELLDDVIQGLVDAVENEEIPLENIDNSVRRILTLKAELNLLDDSFLNESEDEVVANAQAVVGSDENRANEREIANRAVTLIENAQAALPIKPEADDHILFITADSNQVPGTEFSIERMQLEEVIPNDFTYEVLTYNEDSNFTDFADAISQATHVVVYTSMVDEESLSADNFRTAIPQEIFSYAKEQGIVTIQVSINKPYDAINFTDRDAVLISYGYNGMDPTEGGQEPVASFGPNIPAVVEVIFGLTASEEGPTGQLPVDLPVIEDGTLITTEVAYPIGYHSEDWN